MMGAGLGKRYCGQREGGKADGHKRGNGGHCQQHAQGAGVLTVMPGGVTVMRHDPVNHCGGHKRQQQHRHDL